MDEPGPKNETSGLVDHFFRHQYARLVARLCRKYGAVHVADIEDAVQWALERALGSWVRRGIPESPEGWLARVAENSLIDQLRRGRRLVGQEASTTDAEVDPASGRSDDVSLAGEIADAELRMLFVCCEESIPPRGRLVLCLKLLCGFGIREIAAQLFIEEENAQKIFQRAREQLQKSALLRDDPMSAPTATLAPRLSSVQKAIYLQFTEGHSSHQEETPVRLELCLEALRLAELLVNEPVGQTPSSWALLALLHFQFARLASRTNAGGELVLLEEQDRSTWDAHHIVSGLRCLSRSAQGDEFSCFHGEAAILAEHCLSPSYAETRWQEIVELYELLERLAPSPLYTLNKAIALAEWKGPDEALRLLEEVRPPSWLVGYYLWDGTIGELHRRAGRMSEARLYLERARAAAPNSAQRRIFEWRLAQTLS